MSASAVLMALFGVVVMVATAATWFTRDLPRIHRERSKEG